ncbi:MAG: RimK family alpha-L-glutamate ligase [Clostridia bacterium]|nr:RimK family alpha-L-glutamate ligase [Clostridia bacterium]MBR7186408.1 RimK family alpha-L-glutamate ligase [Clostridia bacterium]
MKHAIILINAYTQSEHELNQPLRLKGELERLGVQAEIIRNSPAALRVEADFCIFLDKDKYTAQALEGRMRLFNCAKAIEICDDKMLTHLALSGLPMPETISSLLCYTPSSPVSKELIEEVEARLRFPLVVKENHGSLGKQVYLVKNRGELEKIAEQLKGVPHLYQKYVAESSGCDLRVIVVGGKVVAAMKRTSDSDFRSNAALGGRGEPFAIDGTARALCEEIAARLSLDYCGIDLLFSEKGYLICEVNSNAFFGTIEQVTGVNVARAYAEHIVSSVCSAEGRNLPR